MCSGLLMLAHDPCFIAARHTHPLLKLLRELRIADSQILSRGLYPGDQLLPSLWLSPWTEGFVYSWSLLQKWSLKWMIMWILLLDVRRPWFLCGISYSIWGKEWSICGERDLFQHSWQTSDFTLEKSRCHFLSDKFHKKIKTGKRISRNFRKK